MIRLIQRRLIIPRGDTGTFTVPVIATKNTGDVAVFSIIDNMTAKKVFEKIVQVSGDTMTIEFSHNETVNLPVGKYVWDIKFYQNPEFADGVLVNGVEVDSYYAAFTMPVCEIRQTGDNLLMADDAPGTELSASQLDILNATVNETNAAKNTAVESASTASAAASTATENAATAVASAEEATAALNELKEILPTLAEVATSGSYEDLEDKPFIPSRVSDLTDDSGHYIKPANGIPASDLEETYLTEHQDISGKANVADLAAVATSGDYDDLLNKPTIPEVPVQDVQIEGTSILENGVANIPIASYNAGNAQLGLVRTYGLGIQVDNNTGELSIKKASNGQIKRGSGTTAPIVAEIQHQSVFYGLAAAAGDTTQSQSDNAVGTYTNSAKTAIQTMLDVPSNAAMTTAIGNAIGNINSFDMAVVQELPAQDISTHTIYLVPKTGETNDVYDEYVYINNNWEMVGNTQIDLSNYVQKTDYATADNAGIVRVSNTSEYGIAQLQTVDANNNLRYTGEIGIYPASNGQIKASNSQYNPITPSTQYRSVFYGLAKAAGDSTQFQSSNAVGTYTDEAKAAIQTMLDVPSKADIPDTSIYAEKTEVPVESGTEVGSVKTKDFEYSGVTFANTASGVASFAEGISATASGNYSHAEGNVSTASGSASHAEGRSTSSGKYSHSEGYNTEANADYSHAEGRLSIAHGTYSHAEGYNTLANSAGSHAEGSNTTAFGYYSHVEGMSNIAEGACSHVSGKYNVLDSYISWPDWTPSNEYAIGDRVKITSTVDNETIITGYICKTANSDNEFTAENWTKDIYYNNAETIGNGSGANARSNAYALDWEGNGHYAGDVYVHANADSTGGTKLATIEDIPTVPVQDVQVNDTSVVTNGVANVPVASSSTFGVAKTNTSYGTNVYNGQLQTALASTSSIKAGTQYYQPIVPYYQDYAVFYGLAKAAGSDEKNSTLPVGQYTDAAKEAIQSMLGVSQMLAPVNPNMTAAQAYAIGEVFAANGKLYKATAAIAQDAAIIPDTNCEETTMAEAGGKIRDVQVNGTSVVGSDGVASIPTGGGSANKKGVVWTNGTAWGIRIYESPGWEGALSIVQAEPNVIKTGNNGSFPITSMHQHDAVYYGLSKAAGVDLANETVTLGTYPEASKTAIKAMLGVEEGLKVVRLI